MLLKQVIGIVEDYFKALNKEFFFRKTKWSILDRYEVENEINLLIEVCKNGATFEKKYVISEHSSNSYRVKGENGHPQIVLKEGIGKRIAIDCYGGQVEGVSLLIEEIPTDHLQTVPAT